MIKLQMITGSWCGVCHALLPVAKSYAEQHGILFEEVDADAHPDVADNITQLPLLRILIDDQEAARWSGAFTMSNLRDLVKASL
jgi:thioredoxin-like negative regulator of GroEL